MNNRSIYKKGNRQIIRSHLSGTHKVSNKPSTKDGQRLGIEIWRTDTRYSFDENLPASDFVLQLFNLRFGQSMV
jgi:hypothetical protein